MSRFTVVIACQLPDNLLLALASHLYARNIPLLSTMVNGLVGCVRLSVPDVLGMLLEPPLNRFMLTTCLTDAVVETHFENDRHDLHIHPSQLQHFPELDAFLSRFNPSDRTDTEEQAHIPYPAILVYCARKWKESVGALTAVPAFRLVLRFILVWR